jgi:hypothetical protein
LAEERAVTLPTVISPPKREMPETCTDALAVVVPPDAAVTLEDTEPAWAIEPSAG